MDYKLANHYAKRIKRGENGGLYQQLTKICIPHFLYLRQKLGFHRIPTDEVMNKLAVSAVSEAFIAQEKRKLPFTICLHNAFRDCCRNRIKSMREENINDIISKCDTQNFPLVISTGTQLPSAEVQAQKNEIVGLINNILNGHDKFSKKVVYQKMRGSTHLEIAEIFNATLNKCKQVYYHDINHTREKLRRK